MASINPRSLRRRALLQLTQLEPRDTPGSLLDRLLAESIPGAGAPALGPSAGPFGRSGSPLFHPPAPVGGVWADLRWLGERKPDTSKPSQPTSGQADADTPPRRKADPDDLLPDWMRSAYVRPVEHPVDLVRSFPTEAGGGDKPADAPVGAADYHTPTDAGPAAGEARAVPSDASDPFAGLGVRVRSAQRSTAAGSLRPAPPAPMESLVGDLPVVSVTSYDGSVAELQGGGTSGAVEFDRTGPTDAALTVQYQLDGTATPGVDYTGLAGPTGSAVIPAGQSFVRVKVTALDDPYVEGTETAIVTVLSVDGVYQADSQRDQAFLNVADNDPLNPGMAMQVWVGRVDATAQKDYEAPSNPQNLGRIELRRSVAAGMLSVNFSVSGDAVLNTDYSLWGPVATGYYNQINDTKLGASGKVTFADGQDGIWVRVVPVMSGGVAVTTADFAVTAGAGYTVIDPHDGAVGVYGDRSPGFSIEPNPNGGYTGQLLDAYVTTGQEMLGGPYTGDAAASEAGSDPGAFLVTYQYQSDDPGFVPPDPPAPMWVLGGTATEGEDYTATTTRVVAARTDQSIYFPSTGKTVYRISSVDRIDVTPIDDSAPEGGETVDVAVGRAATDDGGVIGDAQITIADNDSAVGPTVWVEAPDGVSTEWGTTGAFRIKRDDTKLAYTLTVSYSLGGTATFPSDYTVAGPNGPLGATGTVTFQPGQDTIELTVTPQADSYDEGLEDAELTITNGGGAYVLGNPPQAKVAIKDDRPLSGSLEVMYGDNQGTHDGWVPVNNDNDNYNFVGNQATSTTHLIDKDETGQVFGENDLVKLRIYPVLNAVAGDKVQLTFSGIKIWRLSDKNGGEVVSGQTQFSATDTTDVYIEGLALSARRKDVRITLTWVSGTNPTVTRDLDVAFVTVYEVTGAMDVPGYSRHTYTCKYPGAVEPGAGWGEITGGSSFQTVAPVTANGYTTNTQIISWGVGGGLIGGIYQVAMPGGFVVNREVNVVKIAFDSADNSMRFSDTFVKPPDTQTPFSFVSSTSVNPADPFDPTKTPFMKATLRVATVEGPLVRGTRRGERFLEMGWMQSIIFKYLHADYSDGRITATVGMVGGKSYAYEGGTYNDGTIQGSGWQATQYPQTYNRLATDDNMANDNRLFTNVDSPSGLTLGNHRPDGTFINPYWGPNADGTVVRYPLFYSWVEDFWTYFGVRTLETVNGADLSFTVRAQAQWTLEGSQNLTISTNPNFTFKSLTTSRTTPVAIGKYYQGQNGAEIGNPIQFAEVTDGTIYSRTLIQGPLATTVSGDIRWKESW